MTETSKWLKDLELDDLPEAHRKLAEIIGVEATVKLCEACGGMAYYIPMPDGLYTSARAKLIRREYNGMNVQKLARKYNLTARAIYGIVEGVNAQIDGQLDLLSMIDGQDVKRFV